MNNLVRVIGLVCLCFAVFTVSAGMDKKSIEARTMPVGKVCMEGDDCGSASAAMAAGPMEPADIYQTSCFGCHGTGALDSPKFGDAGAWSARVLAKGKEALIANAINGINSMPAMGTCAACSEDDIAATVEYMLENSQ